ncbi:glycosyltransferase family 4 protein [Lysobacter xanthus]
MHERFPPDYAGGGEYVVLETARHLQARGHVVRVLTAGDPAIGSFEGIATRRLPVSRYRFNGAWREVAAMACDADLIHCFTYHSVVPAQKAGRALGKPVVLEVLALFDDVWLEMRGPVVGRAFRAMEKFLLRLPLAGRIFLSDDSLALARSLGSARPDDTVIAPGISLADYHAAADKPYVLFAGKLDVRKGIDVVLQVAANMPDVPFRIIGWGERYDDVAARCPPNVAIERFRDRQHLAEVLSAARIFLFPTKAETFGLIVAEAMASGCAVVSTSPLPFAGEKIVADDADAATRAVGALWKDPVRCAEAGRQNLATARMFTWDAHVDALERLYARVLDRP